jgi:hypothetical protein
MPSYISVRVPPSVISQRNVPMSSEASDFEALHSDTNPGKHEVNAKVFKNSVLKKTINTVYGNRTKRINTRWFKYDRDKL